MEQLWELLGVDRGVTAVMGSGGKTSLLYQLAEELRPRGTVLLATTTHIMKPPQYPFAVTAEELTAALAAYGAACAGSYTPEGKLTAPSFGGWQQAADFVLVEADGSRRRPLKAHALHEPVIPPCTRQVICVVGLSGLHRPVSEVVHRPELFCPLASCTPEDEATPERVARALVQEHLADTYFLNQAESGSALQDAKIIASHLKPQGFSVVAGSQREKRYYIL